VLRILHVPPQNYQHETTEVRALLERSLHRLLHKDLEAAVQSASQAHDIAARLLVRAKADPTGGSSNSFFVVVEFTTFVLEFARYWVELDNRNYAQSWSRLQDAIDALRLVDDFTEDGALFHISFFKHLCANIEKIYPYHMFISTENIIKRATCSICGLNEFDPNCEHFPGELYNGELAYHVVEDMEPVAVSWVENPDDKRCVVIDPPPDFSPVEYYREHCPSPLVDIEVTQTKALSPEDRSKLGRNVLCPCSSGKKYKKCCIDKPRVEVPHIHIELGHLLRPVFDGEPAP
jgi:hypothetical protein